MFHPAALAPKQLLATSRRWLRPLKWITPPWCTLDDARSQPGVAWLPLADPGPWFTPPRQWGWDGYDLMSQLPPQHHRLGVLDLAGGRVDDLAGAVQLADGTLVPATTWWTEHPTMVAKIKLHRWSGRGTWLSGTTLTLVSDWADNYGHYLHDILGKLAVASASGVAVHAVDRVLLPTPSSPHAQRLLDRALERCRIPRERLHWWHGRERFRCERLLAPVSPALLGMVAPPAAHALRRLLAPADAPAHPAPSRRLFLDRIGHTRRLTNGDDLRARALAAGFEPYHPEDHPQTQAEDFAAASAVLGLHGSALNNLLFCAPGTPVIEIMSTDHANMAPISLGYAAGCRHAVVFADAGIRQPRHWGTGLYNSPRPCTVDPALVDAAAAALAMPGWEPRPAITTPS